LRTRAGTPARSLLQHSTVRRTPLFGGARAADTGVVAHSSHQIALTSPEVVVAAIRDVLAPAGRASSPGL